MINNYSIHIYTAIMLLSLMSCHGGPKTTPITPELNADSKYEIEELYGEEFEIGNKVYSVEKTMKMLSKQDTVDVVLEANVKSVCKKKGCWMNLVDTKNPSDDEAFFVKFVDYGFFMPLDSEGYRVLVKGQAYKEVTTVDELRHYAEDEGKSPEEIAKITEPAEELKILSSGVFKVKS